MLNYKKNYLKTNPKKSSSVLKLTIIPQTISKRQTGATKTLFKHKLTENIYLQK